MKFGLSVPNIGALASVQKILTVATDAEASGWDGVFLWDSLAGFPAGSNPPTCDPWIALGAIAISTERVRIGTMITPVARRRPWKLARETVTLDRLSNGRLTLGVGLGNPSDDFSLFGEDAEDRTRAAKLDEGLEILVGLWSAQPFSFQGEHFKVLETQFRPPPAQQPCIPIWVGGQWPNKGPFRRAARFEGVYPVKAEGSQVLSMDEVRAAIEYTRSHRDTDADFDVVLAGKADKQGRQERGPALREYAAAGATWWLTELGGMLSDVDAMRAYVRAGPPTV